jgi:drug/metabolite transporter (DMT)-like permease
MMNKFGAFFGLTLASLVWGLSFIWTKQVFIYWGPFTLCLFRMLFASLLIAAYMMVKGISFNMKGEFLSFLLMAICEPFIYFIGESYGLMEVSPGVAALVIGSIPVFLGLSTKVYGHEKADRSFFVGVLFSLLGLVVVSFDFNGQLRYSLLGLSLLFLAVASAVFYNQVIKLLSKLHRPETIVFWQSFIGAGLFLPLFLFFEWRHFVEGLPYKESVWKPFLYLSIFASTLSFIIYNHAVKKVGMLKANLFVCLIPAFALLASFWLEIEEVRWYKIVGLLCMVTGVFMASRKSSSKAV